MFKKGHLVMLASDDPYIVSTANKGGMFKIMPDMLGLFLGYTETYLSYSVAVVLFGDVMLSISADKLKAVSI